MKKTLSTAIIAFVTFCGLYATDIINTHFDTGEAWNLPSFTDCEAKGDRVVTTETTFTNDGFVYTTADCSYTPTCAVKKTPAASGLTTGYLEINKTGYLIIPEQSSISTIDITISATGTSGRGIIVEKSVNGGAWVELVNQKLTKDDQGIGSIDIQSGYVFPTINVNESNVAIKIYSGSYAQNIRIHDLRVQSQDTDPGEPQPTSTFWNVSDFETGNFTTDEKTLTVNGRILTAVAGGSEIKIEDRTSSLIEIDDYTFSKRMNLGGAGFNTGENDAVPTKRYLKFDVSGAAKFTVYGNSSSETEAKVLVASDGTAIFDDWTSPPFVSKASDKNEFQYAGPAGTIYLYSRSGGIYINGILLEETAATGISSLAPDKAIKAVQYYDLLGRPVTDAKGILIVRTVYADGSSSIQKIFN
ncbi:MAG: hypothetical protein LBD45_04485 [Bacteroidales bacterium]|nr:hypothetical protein [Bacteroidales bacterium]